MKETLFFFAIILFIDASYSQEFDRTQKVKITHSENITVGYILSYDTAYCLVELEDKDHTISRILTKDIEKIEPYQIEIEEEMKSEPSDYRLFIFPTGKTLKAGKVAISFHEFALPIVSVGVFDGLTLSIGAFPVGPVILVFPKISMFHSKNTDMALSGIYIGIPGQLPLSGAFLIHTTRINDNISATFGGGIIYYPNRFLDLGGTPSSSPYLVLGLETRVTKNIKTIFEGWILADYSHPVFLPTGGARLFWEKFSMDFALGLFTGSGIFYPIPIPLVTVSWTF